MNDNKTDAKSSTGSQHTWSQRTCRASVWPLALMGLVVIIEGLLGGAPRHRLFAALVGLVLLLPIALPQLFRSKWQALRPKVLLFASCSLLSLLLIEAGVRWIHPSSFQHPEPVPDPVLSYRMQPARGGMDALGFRNTEVPDRADVVCLGDSQTYGAAVRLSETFPSVLAQRSGTTVYNMSLGGYGPVQYLALTERALEMQPVAIVIGFYFGNDIIDAYSLAGLPHWARLRNPRVTYLAPKPEATTKSPEPNLAMVGLSLLIESSSLVQFVHAEFTARMKKSQYLADTYWKEPGAPRYEGGKIQTLFTPKMRLSPVRTATSRVRDGLRITELCLSEMHVQCEQAGVRLVMLLLDTKEYYYHGFLIERNDAAADSLEAVAAAETVARTKVMDIAGRLGIAVIDPQRAVLAALNADQALWPPNSDGHFSAEGCALLAEVLRTDLLKICPRLADERSSPTQTDGK